MSGPFYKETNVSLFKFLKKDYLSPGCAGPLLLHTGFPLALESRATPPGCGAWAPRRGGFSRGASVGAARGLRNPGLPVAEPALSTCGQGLRGSAARGIVLDQGPNPCPLRCQEDSCPLCYQGSLCINHLRNGTHGHCVPPEATTTCL